MEDIYISTDDIQVCLCCKQKRDTRFGICFDCAEAESIIGEGCDMFDKTIPVSEVLTNYSEAINILRFLIIKGWQSPIKK